MSDCRFSESSRPGLYLLVFFILLNSCEAADRLRHLKASECVAAQKDAQK